MENRTEFKIWIEGQEADAITCRSDQESLTRAAEQRELAARAIQMIRSQVETDDRITICLQPACALALVALVAELQQEVEALRNADYESVILLRERQLNLALAENRRLLIIEANRSQSGFNPPTPLPAPAQ